MQVPESASSSQFEEDDDDLPDIPWKKLTAALPDGANLNDKNHIQTADKAVAASPPTMKPKSYATVAKASVVAAAAPEPAVVPRLCAAASMPSTDLKPSTTASEIATDTASLKVNICTHACALCSMGMNVHLNVHRACVPCVGMHACVRAPCVWYERVERQAGLRRLLTCTTRLYRHEELSEPRDS
jgi:hypothetical protein